MKSLDISVTGTKIDYITIKFTSGRAIGRLNRSSVHTASVPYSSFTHKLGSIHRAGGRVISISTPYAHAVRSEVVLPEVTIAIADVVSAAAPVVETVLEVTEPAIVETVVETITEAVAEVVIAEEPVAASVIEAEPVIEKVAESVIEPVAEQVTEPVAEPVAEVVENVIEPVAEIEPNTKPKKSRSSSKSGGFNKPKVDTAPAKATRSPRKPKS